MTAQRRQMPVPKLVNLVRGDLDWIVMRCLEKDRVRRYETANGLAADLLRHLHHEPVSACPPSQWYRLRKLVRRNKLVFAAGAAVASALVLGMLVSTWQAVRASRAERTAQAEAKRADGEAAIAKAVNEFLVNDLLSQADSQAQADAKITPNPNLTVREALDRAGAKVGMRFKAQPLTEAAVRNAIGRTYLGVGDFANAALHLDRAAKLDAVALGAEHPDTLRALTGLANAYQTQGKYDQAITLNTSVYEIRQRVLGENDPETLTSRNNLGTLYYQQGKYDQAEAHFTKLLDVQRRILGKQHSDTLRTMSNLGAVLHSQRKYKQAGATYAQALDGYRRTAGELHPMTLTVFLNSAMTAKAQGSLAEAEMMYDEALRLHQSVFGPEHPRTLVVMHSLASLYRSQGKYSEAEGLSAKVVEKRSRVLGEEHPDTLRSAFLLAGIYLGQGRYQQAEPFLNSVARARLRIFGPEHTDYLSTLLRQGELYILQNRQVEAEQALKAAVKGYEKYGSANWDRYLSLALLGIALDDQGKRTEAKPVLVSGCEGLVKQLEFSKDEDYFFLREAGKRLVSLYESEGDREKAVAWTNKLRQF